jgi:hypothetical protein
MKLQRALYFVLLAMLMACFGVGCVHAQSNADIRNLKNATPGQRAAFQTKMMKDKLKLDAGQVTKAQAINLKYAQKFQPIIKSTDNRFSKMKQAMALQKQKDQELQGVFTKEQFSQYQAFEAEMRSKMRAAYKN